MYKQIFIFGPPRSGTTIIAQAINTHPSFRIFDEVGFMIPTHEGSVNFLKHRELLDHYTRMADNGKSNTDNLDTVLSDFVGEGVIWGEKYPDYALYFPYLRSLFPNALFIFILRDPRRVAKSYLSYSNSELRTNGDFWIKDSSEDAFKLLAEATEPLISHRDAISILKYESFVSDPLGTLNSIFEPVGFTYSADMMDKSNTPLESIFENHFFREDKILPWKSENLNQITKQKDVELSEEVYASEGWAKIEKLAKDLGYQ